jgi:hypothetical protein
MQNPKTSKNQGQTTVILKPGSDHGFAEKPEQSRPILLFI